MRTFNCQADIAVSYNNLALEYYRQGKYEKAEELHEKALRIREHLLGEEHPDTTESYNNLALVYSSQGKCEKAEELHEKALRIRERLLGEDHPSTATSYNNLAFVYAQQEKYKISLSYSLKLYYFVVETWTKSSRYANCV